jgi:hypothetical protein
VVRKKLGLTLESDKTDGERVYRIVMGGPHQGKIQGKIQAEKPRLKFPTVRPCSHGAALDRAGPEFRRSRRTLTFAPSRALAKELGEKPPAASIWR